MSLIRQLWYAVSTTMFAILLGTLVVSVFTARGYLEQQLLTQANDGAASLAIAITQQGSDPGTAETLINATFDSGHYKTVRYVDTTGKVLIERTSPTPKGKVPNWFISLFPLHAQPGTASVNRGWQQAGEIYIESHTQFAHESLWSGSLALLLILAAAGALWAIGVSYIMKRLRRPLDSLTDKAKKIGEGQFLIVPQTQVTELVDITRAMNHMSNRVKTMFAEQAARITELQTDVSRDGVTGLTNRSFFMGELRNALSDETSHAGVLTLVRIRNLQLINRTLGREKTDHFLKSIANELATVFGTNEESTIAARLNGADFAVLVKDGETLAVSALSKQWQARLASLCATLGTEYEALADISVTYYQRPESFGNLLSRADNSLMQAEISGQGLYVTPSAPLSESLTESAWASLLRSALKQHSFKLAFYPVLSSDGTLLHEEGMLRLCVPGESEPISAGRFMPAAIRLNMVSECDLIAVELALKRIKEYGRPVAVNLAPQTLLVTDIDTQLYERLKSFPHEATMLSVEVSERGLDEDATTLTALGKLLASFGSSLGIEHFGRKLSVLPNLYALNVSYLKLDGSVVHGLPENAGNQRLVKAIVDMANGLSVQVMAEQVHTQEEWKALENLGVVGMTGPAASKLYQQ